MNDVILTSLDGWNMTTEIIDQARELYKNGKREESRELLMREIRANLKDADLWFALYWCVDDAKQKQDCLELALKLNPDHEKAKIELQSLAMPEGKEPTKPVKPVVKDQPQRINHQILRDAAQRGQAIQQPQAVKIPTTPIVSKSPVSKPRKPQKTLKQAGDSTYTMAEKYRRIGLGAGFGVIAIIMILGYIFSKPNIYKIGGPAALIILLFLMYSPQIVNMVITPFEKRMNLAKQGARAEVEIGTILAGLGDDYLVIHDILADYGNIDHVVICKNGGVFMIETKSHVGKVTIENDKFLLNGKPPEKDFIAQSRRNSFWLKDKIKAVTGVKNTWVTPILVFTNAFVDKKYPPFHGVYLKNEQYLLKTIEGQKKNDKVGTSIWDKRDKIVEAIQ
jgi:hypothetical protein